ncbi:MAG TPA: LuxR C-terminal-related transcriptional regulator [Thermoanaerobaculia bacterium]|nr:LuxR C-terminal-related transcriptional regulator [Thermoanaerobaculia bacterium]
MRMLDRHFRAVLDNAADGVLIEAGERISYVNDPYARMLGYRSVTELSDATIRDIAHPEDFERLSWFGHCRTMGKPAPTRYSFRARGRGGIVTFDATVSLTRVDGEILIMTVVREVPEACAAAEFSLPGLQRLSPRELDVLRLLLQGKRSKEIAAMWNVSEKTIGTHRSRAFQKLALRSDLDLFRLAAEMGAL